MQRPPMVLGHRGASAEAPENTLAAFRRALDLGADGVEFDVQMSRDGEVVVMHDERVDRTTDGKGWVKDLTLAQLRHLDAGGWFDPRFRGEHIPTLAEALEVVAGPSRLINVELKSGIVIYPGIEARVVEILKRFGVLEKCVISSFNHFSLRALKTSSPSVRAGILYVEALVDPWAYAVSVPADALHPAHHGVFPELVAQAHAAGLAVNAWTVDEPGAMRRMRECGVDAIITNQVGKAVETMKEG